MEKLFFKKKLEAAIFLLSITTQTEDFLRYLVLDKRLFNKHEPIPVRWASCWTYIEDINIQLLGRRVRRF
jgi:hypothetical protein